MLTRSLSQIRCLQSQGRALGAITAPLSGAHCPFSTNGRPFKSEFFRLPVQLEPIGQIKEAEDARDMDRIYHFDGPGEGAAPHLTQNSLERMREVYA